jgi:hypothetical protein
VDASLTLACALEVEEKAARRVGAKVVRVGLGAAHVPLPDGRFVGFGLAGSLVPALGAGALISATRIVDEAGDTLWEGEPLNIPGARPTILCAARSVVDEPGARTALAKRSGAEAVDTESSVFAESGRLAGVVRAISDTPKRPLGRLAHAAKPDGRVDALKVVGAFLAEPQRAVPAALAARRGLKALSAAASALTLDRR